MKPTDVLIGPGVEFTGTYEHLPWSKVKAQDAQLKRAAKRKAELAEQQTPRDLWLAKIRRAG